MIETPLTNCLPLAAVPNAVPLARVFIRQTLIVWQYQQLIEDAELLASELVTNAVKATPRLRLIKICMFAGDGLAVIEVWDPNPQPPVMPQEIDTTLTGGRGLQIVASLSKSWGYRHPSQGGKTVWCELPISA